MPPERALLEQSQVALARWQDLRAAYDAIERALGAADPADLAALAAHLLVLEDDLKPRMRALTAVRAALPAADAPLAAVWRETDSVVASLVSRQPQLVRAALAARAATAQRLADLRIARGQLRSYAGPALGAPRFTSRCA